MKLISKVDLNYNKVLLCMQKIQSIHVCFKICPRLSFILFIAISGGIHLIACQVMSHLNRLLIPAATLPFCTFFSFSLFVLSSTPSLFKFKRANAGFLVP